MFSNIVIDSSSTRVDSSVIDETRVGTLTTRGSTTKGSKYIGLKRVSPHILNSMYGVRGGHRMPSKAYPSVFIWYSIFTFL